MDEKIFIVHLRRPSSEPSEMRSDPFWEFGSFGVTGCHDRNLLNVKRIDRIKSARFAFVQGGNLGFKLLLITPPISCHIRNGICEVRWAPVLMPFKYAEAPTVINNKGESDFLYLRALFETANRLTYEGKFSSVFRSNATPLKDRIGKRLYDDFNSNYGNANKSKLAAEYIEALPSLPPLEDKNRWKTYQNHIRELKRKCKIC